RFIVLFPDRRCSLRSLYSRVAMSPQASISVPAFIFEPKAETMPRDELTALQTARLQRTLELAYANVDHFRRQFDGAGVNPGNLKTLPEHARFPFTGKADLRDNYPFGMFAVPRERLLRVHASSGTTGKPTVVGYTQGDLAHWADLMARSLACA